MWDTVINVVVCPVIRSFKQSGSRGYKGLRGVKWITRLAGGYKNYRELEGVTSCRNNTAHALLDFPDYTLRRGGGAGGLKNTNSDVRHLPSLRAFFNCYIIWSMHSPFRLHSINLCVVPGESLRRVIKYHLKPKNKSRLSGIHKMTCDLVWGLLVTEMSFTMDKC